MGVGAHTDPGRCDADLRVEARGGAGICDRRAPRAHRTMPATAGHRIRRLQEVDPMPAALKRAATIGVLFALLAGCSDEKTDASVDEGEVGSDGGSGDAAALREGMSVGDCTDRADNDGDGAFDKHSVTVGAGERRQAWKDVGVIHVR